MKKKTVIALLALAPVVASAQSFGDFSQGDMQDMMKQAQQMQECISQVDQSQLEKLQRRAETMESEVRNLCRDGKRDQAQSRAIDFGREVADDPTMKNLRECGEIGMKMLEKTAFASFEGVDADRDYHICDAM